MTDLTDNAGGLHRAKPRGAIDFVLGDRQRLAPILFCWPDVVSRPSSGRGRFHPVSPVFDRRNETIASAQRFAAVKWSGRKAGESGQAAGGTGSALEARHELKR